MTWVQGSGSKKQCCGFNTILRVPSFSVNLNSS